MAAALLDGALVWSLLAASLEVESASSCITHTRHWAWLGAVSHFIRPKCLKVLVSSRERSFWIVESNAAAGTGSAKKVDAG